MLFLELTLYLQNAVEIHYRLNNSITFISSKTNKQKANSTFVKKKLKARAVQNYFRVFRTTFLHLMKPIVPEYYKKIDQRSLNVSGFKAYKYICIALRENTIWCLNIFKCTHIKIYTCFAQNQSSAAE